MSDAKTVAYAHLRNGKLMMTSPICVSDDSLRVTLIVHPVAGHHLRSLEKRDLVRILSSQGIRYGVDWSVVRTVLDQATRSDRILADEVATGRDCSGRGRFSL
ncbi:MAG: hypothetical protein HRU17_04285 [Polyangiaceae bacterium]|nr:hypothetical protein [Polyangiaceae bacterium]